MQGEGFKELQEGDRAPG
ncbi:hypothetical protein OG331_42115 [Streptomyces sp. NBC_01017]|nr:hypothetical protein OG331_42115 [Streptomyces sp. NBC_01017]